MRTVCAFILNVVYSSVGNPEVWRSRATSFFCQTANPCIAVVGGRPALVHVRGQAQVPALADRPHVIDLFVGVADIFKLGHPSVSPSLATRFPWKRETFNWDRFWCRFMTWLGLHSGKTLDGLYFKRFKNAPFFPEISVNFPGTSMTRTRCFLQNAKCAIKAFMLPFKMTVTFRRFGVAFQLFMSKCQVQKGWKINLGQV